MIFIVFSAEEFSFDPCREHGRAPTKLHRPCIRDPGRANFSQSCTSASRLPNQAKLLHATKTIACKALQYQGKEIWEPLKIKPSEISEFYEMPELFFS
jgi:hypothetical protein